MKIAFAFSRTKRAAAALVGLIVVTGECPAQWTTQTIQLRPGWNAVYLEVQPEPRECTSLFAGLPVESVWFYNNRFSPVQFIQHPDETLLENPDWLIYLPPGHPLAATSSLYAIEGGHPYLIKLPSTAPSLNWSVQGMPVSRRPEWISDSMNFVGFQGPDANAPTFRSFFASSPAHSNSPVYTLLANGNWALALSSQTMRRGEAFWIQTLGQSSFSGPVELLAPDRRGLVFGRAQTELTIRLRNGSTSSRTLTIRQLSSDVPPPGAESRLAGAVPLGYWQNDFDHQRVGWTNWPGTLSATVPPGGVWELRLEVRRRDMTLPPPGPGESLYQSLLEITDAAGGTRILLPVTAEGLHSATGGSGAGAGLSAADSPASPDPRAGLWIGHATISKVNNPGQTNPGPGDPVPTASEFSFRLLVHVDAVGQARLLQNALEMWQPGTYRLADDGSTNLVVDQPGRFVLVADNRRIGEFTGATLRDGQPVARRFSTAAFGFREPQLMSGSDSFGEGGSIRACAITLDYRDPLNPFVHVFHPDHNNLDEDYLQVFPEGKESFSVTREIFLQFGQNDPEKLALAGWGDNQLGGSYYEVLGGLHKNPISVSGTFRLHRASRVERLE